MQNVTIYPIFILQQFLHVSRTFLLDTSTTPKFSLSLIMVQEWAKKKIQIIKVCIFFLINAYCIVGGGGGNKYLFYCLCVYTLNMDQSKSRNYLSKFRTLRKLNVLFKRLGYSIKFKINTTLNISLKYI